MQGNLPYLNDPGTIFDDEHDPSWHADAIDDLIEMVEGQLTGMSISLSEMTDEASAQYTDLRVKHDGADGLRSRLQVLLQMAEDMEGPPTPRQSDKRSKEEDDDSLGAWKKSKTATEG